MLVAWTHGKQLGRYCLWWWWEGELKKGPELGPHRQGGDRLFQAGRALLERYFLWDLKWEKFVFSTQGTGSHTRYGARRGVDSIWVGGKG